MTLNFDAKITGQRRADEFVRKFGSSDLGKELILMYNTVVADAQELQKIETRPYFLGRLTEAQLEEERKKARRKGEKEGRRIGERIGKQIGEQIGEQRGKQIGEQIGEQRGEYKKAIKAAKNMLAGGVAPELIVEYLEIDIDTVRSLKP